MSEIVEMIKRKKDGSWAYPKCKKCGRKTASSFYGMCGRCYSKSIGKEWKGY